MASHEFKLNGRAASILAAGAMAAPVAAEAQGSNFVVGRAAEDAAIRVRGRLFLDSVRQDVRGEPTAAGGVGRSSDHQGRVRLARIAVLGDLSPEVSFGAEVDFAGQTTTVTDLFVRYSPSDRLAFTVGNIKTLGLEETTSDTVTTFMERGPYSDLTGVGRVVTAAAQLRGADWTVTGAVAGDDINEPAVAGDEQRSLQVRATWGPKPREELQLHLGAWTRVRDRNEDSDLEYELRPNTRVGRAYVVSGEIGRRDRTVALEAAIIRGPLSIQGEWARIDVEPTIGDRSELQTAYVFASGFVTGEARAYDAREARFEAVDIRRPLGKGGPGAVEFAIRYDWADLTKLREGSVVPPLAGRYDGVIFGANWFPVAGVRLAGNYSVSRNNNPADRFDADVRTLQFRVQLDF